MLAENHSKTHPTPQAIKSSLAMTDRKQAGKIKVTSMWIVVVFWFIYCLLSFSGHCFLVILKSLDDLIFF